MGGQAGAQQPKMSRWQHIRTVNQKSLDVEERRTLLGGRLGHLHSGQKGRYPRHTRRPRVAALRAKTHRLGGPMGVRRTASPQRCVMAGCQETPLGCPTLILSMQDVPSCLGPGFLVRRTYPRDSAVVSWRRLAGMVMHQRGRLAFGVMVVRGWGRDNF